MTITQLEWYSSRHQERVSDLLINTTDQPFWETRSLQEMSREEWESLCDGCGRCCLEKLEDETSGEVYFTNIACRLLDTDDCCCCNYPERTREVPDCMVLSPDHLDDINWLPKSCAYRRIKEGRGLAPWHHLVSGSCTTVHEAGISVRGKTISAQGIGIEEYENHVVDWIE
ncbi:MAG TPA: YcgN family cysteine cluster protein [Chromatiaceae bacterium]|nr:YcgN family cysteine cluster protein [Chromatiaceae bacterium]HIA07720.1 YcgN family cysteine cluster protein [Chromatiaceae bacterium]HIN81711.1 YcgN family cysteine cluster protein [Chromatiales bacterium]HIO14819.1 YcgN family cysteine cluster protein [Chromatiales bacterium]HIO55221.1 YcgN family cysteine cluster protein [Chromatiales bacterium]